jgi:opacity protein-like surface antigen
MKMNKRVLAIAAAASLMLSTGAFAQGYLGFSAGATKLHDSCEGTLTCDTTDTGGKVFAGYKFLPYLGAEVIYFDFGKAKGTVDLGEGGIAAFDVKTTAVGAGVLLTGTFAETWTGSARLGVAQVKVNVGGSYEGISGLFKPRSTQGYLGLGVGYLVTRNLSIDAAYDYTRARIESSTADFSATDNVSLYSIGLTYTF